MNINSPFWRVATSRPNPFFPRRLTPRDPPYSGPLAPPRRGPRSSEKWVKYKFPFWRVATQGPHPFFPRRLTPRDPPYSGPLAPFVRPSSLGQMNIYIFPHSERCPLMDTPLSTPGSATAAGLLIASPAGSRPASPRENLSIPPICEDEWGSRRRSK